LSAARPRHTVIIFLSSTVAKNQFWTQIYIVFLAHVLASRSIVCAIHGHLMRLRRESIPKLFKNNLATQV